MVNTDISVGLVRTEDPDRPSSYAGGGNGVLNSENNLGYSNVISYGAKGDGTTDDTIAIQTAIDSTMLNGGRVYFPDGNYIITKALHLYSGSVLIGSSQNSTKIIQHSEDNHIEGKDCNFVTIKDMCFKGPGLSATTGGGLVFDREHNSNIAGINLENVTVEQCVEIGIAINRPISAIFNNVRVMAINGSGYTFNQAGASVTMNSCYAINCRKAGFHFDNMNYSTLNSCTAQQCGIGYHIRNNSNNIALIGCGAEEQGSRNIIDQFNYQGVDFQLEGGVANSIISCYSKSDCYAGILVKNGSPSIIGYREEGAAEYGIWADEDSHPRIINSSCSSPIHLPDYSK